MTDFAAVNRIGIRRSYTASVSEDLRGLFHVLNDRYPERASALAASAGDTLSRVMRQYLIVFSYGLRNSALGNGKV
jgi:hypothetical protein